MEIKKKDPKIVLEAKRLREEQLEALRRSQEEATAKAFAIEAEAEKRWGSLQWQDKWSTNPIKFAALNIGDRVHDDSVCLSTIVGWVGFAKLLNELLIDNNYDEICYRITRCRVARENDMKKHNSNPSSREYETHQEIIDKLKELENVACAWLSSDRQYFLCEEPRGPKAWKSVPVLRNMKSDGSINSSSNNGSLADAQLSKVRVPNPVSKIAKGIRNISKRNNKKNSKKRQQKTKGRQRK